MSAGPPGTPLAKKLGIEGDGVFTVRNAPDGLAAMLGDIGDAVWQQSLMAPLDVIIGFYRLRASLTKEWPKLTRAVQPDGSIWVAWPKRSSGIASDLTEDVLREQLLPTGWVDTKVCAIDETWSALRFTLRKQLRRPSESRRR